MRPTPCGLVPLLLTLAGSPEKPPSSQVISPETHARPEVIPEVTSPPGAQERVALPGSATPPGADAPPRPRVSVPETHAPPGATRPEEDAQQVRWVFPEEPAWPLRERTGEPPARYENGLFARLVLSRRLGTSGVTFSRLMRTTNKLTQGGELVAWDQCIHRAETLTVVSASLKLSAASTRPWLPGEAWLLDEQGQRVGPFTVWMDVPVLYPGGEGTVAVEVDRVPNIPQGTFWLELREMNGGRVTLLGELTL